MEGDGDGRAVGGVGGDPLEGIRGGVEPDADVVIIRFALGA